MTEQKAIDVLQNTYTIPARGCDKTDLFPFAVHKAV